MGCGLILENMRGLSAMCHEMGFSRNYFVEENPVHQVHGSVDPAPVPESSNQGAGEEEGSTGVLI
jgi:hypothetical protein